MGNGQKVVFFHRGWLPAGGEDALGQSGRHSAGPQASGLRTDCKPQSCTSGSQPEMNPAKHRYFLESVQVEAARKNPQALLRVVKVDLGIRVCLSLGQP